MKTIVRVFDCASRLVREIEIPEVKIDLQLQLGEYAVKELVADDYLCSRNVYEHDVEKLTHE